MLRISENVVEIFWFYYKNFCSPSKILSTRLMEGQTLANLYQLYCLLLGSNLLYWYSGSVLLKLLWIGRVKILIIV